MHDLEFKLGIKQRLYNWNMRVARQRLGLSQRALGEAVGLAMVTICSYENMRQCPNQERAERIAQVLNVSIESLFPGWIREWKLISTPYSSDDRCIGFDEAKRLGLFKPALLTEPASFEVVERNIMNEQLSVEIKSILDEYTGRYKKYADVVNVRFGLIDGRSKTLDEVGDIFGLTRERVRQMEQRVLRDIRKSKKRTKILREYIPE